MWGFLLTTINIGSIIILLKIIPKGKNKMEANQADLVKTETVTPEVKENPHTVTPSDQVCDLKDKECMSRWIASFSDCE